MIWYFCPILTFNCSQLSYSFPIIHRLLNFGHFKSGLCEIFILNGLFILCLWIYTEARTISTPFNDSASSCNVVWSWWILFVFNLCYETLIMREEILNDTDDFVDFDKLSSTNDYPWRLNKLSGIYPYHSLYPIHCTISAIFISLVVIRSSCVSLKLYEEIIESLLNENMRRTFVSLKHARSSFVSVDWCLNVVMGT